MLLMVVVVMMTSLVRSMMITSPLRKCTHLGRGTTQKCVGVAGSGLPAVNLKGERLYPELVV
eukprot:3742263-Pyramimonas_sp.AAC.1